MIETMEMKANFEAMVDKARALSPLRQSREKFALELQNLPYNAISLQIAGRPLIDEKRRLEGEITKLREKEHSILQEVREFFVALAKCAAQPAQEKIPVLLSKRLRLRDLFAEAGVMVAEIESVQRDWTGELDALRKVAAELKNQTNESYPLPELNFPTPLVPSPSVQHVVRLRERGDNLSEIMQAMAKQIG
jgi:hypothetical protein